MSSLIVYVVKSWDSAYIGKTILYFSFPALCAASPVAGLLFDPEKTFQRISWTSTTNRLLSDLCELWWWSGSAADQAVSSKPGGTQRFAPAISKSGTTLPRRRTIIYVQRCIAMTLSILWSSTIADSHVVAIGEAAFLVDKHLHMESANARTCCLCEKWKSLGGSIFELWTSLFPATISIELQMITKSHALMRCCNVLVMDAWPSCQILRSWWHFPC